ncbi:DUF5016 domain-containing protein [Proteiniphilum sp. X52]|uniref:DUF5016 domain-containing protein n=1 Tax=Proteiniphilum sp. X52 TaxID=2382159 RepID=UPI000F0A2C9C|nr:DUF5016 domain-containing protein [Proteiniphilum sp. X52]RNC63976.1 DUF5016 domain-containing protein [Proteiniphilum sp. X52]
MKNKYTYIYMMVSCMAFWLGGCEDDSSGRVVYPYSSPEISNVSYSFANEVEAADSIFFSMDITDPLTPLSTLEVTLTFEDEVIYSETIRTKGSSAQIKNHGIFIPFHSLFDEGDAILNLTAINVEGSEKTELKTFRIKRPELPATLYLHYDGRVLPMTRTENNPYEYQTENGDFPETFDGKISTAPTLEASALIWGLSQTRNGAELVSGTGANFIFNFENAVIQRVIFNTFSFNLGFAGISKIISVNGVQLMLDNNGLYQATIDFTRNADIEVTGIQDLGGAYNRDFFSYDQTTGKLAFIRETGTWTVYYSMKYNYMWVADMRDVAPDAFWLVGHGFTCAPRWHDDYSSGGWNLEDITRLAYAVKTREHTYQATIYLNDTHEWASFEVEIYSDLGWGKEKGMLLSEESFSGDATGFKVSLSNGFTNDTGFVPGYFRLTFDTSGGVGKESMKIERLSN